MNYKKRSTKEYDKIFKAALESDQPIKTMDGTEQLSNVDGQVWCRCYKEGDPVRDILPQYWFVSDRGDLVSCATGRAYLLKKDPDNGRFSYHFEIESKENPGQMMTKNIELHNLVAITFGSEVYGQARSILKEKGILGFGIRNKEKPKMQGHHIYSKDRNKADEVELVSTPVHAVIGGVPSLQKITPERIMATLKRLDEVSGEEPDKITVLLTGQQYDPEAERFVSDDESRYITAVDHVNITEGLLEEYRGFVSAGVVRESVDLLIRQCGVDHFSIPVFMCRVGDHSHVFKCHKSGSKVKIEEVTAQAAADKEIVLCRCKDGKIEIIPEK